MFTELGGKGDQSCSIIMMCAILPPLGFDLQVMVWSYSRERESLAISVFLFSFWGRLGVDEFDAVASGVKVLTKVREVAIDIKKSCW